MAILFCHDNVFAMENTEMPWQMQILNAFLQNSIKDRKKNT
jgi:hypothetical protein